MPYATQANLYTNFSQAEIDRIADRNPPPGGTSDQIAAARAVCIGAALERADVKINAMIGDRIALVFADPDLITAVKYIAMDLARYYLYDDLATEQVKERKDDAVATLKAIRDGKENLGKTQGASSPTLTTDSSIQFQSPTPSANPFERRNGWGGGSY